MREGEGREVKGWMEVREWRGLEGVERREEEGKGGAGSEGGRERGREGRRAKSPIRPPTLRNITSSNVER